MNVCSTINWMLMSIKLRGLLNAVSAQLAESKQALFDKYRINLPLQSLPSAYVPQRASGVERRTEVDARHKSISAGNMSRTNLLAKCVPYFLRSGESVK